MISGSEWLAPRYLGWLWDGFVTTLELSVASAITATALGFVLALMYESRIKSARQVAFAYVFLFRNSPLIIQLMLLYFGVSTLLPDAWMAWLNTPHEQMWLGGNWHWPSFEFLAGWVGLTLYSATFLGEEFRAGLQGVPAGQRGAALALGMPSFTVFRSIVWPQAVRIATPALFGQYMNLVKNSSLAMAIGVAELSYMARQVDTETFKSFQAFGIATLLYVVTIAVLEVVLQFVERHQARQWQ